MPHVWNKHKTNVKPLVVVNPCSDGQEINKPDRKREAEGRTPPWSEQNEDPGE